MAELPRQSYSEIEVDRACSLVGEIVGGRAGGDRRSTVGNSDDDLLYALEEARDQVAAALRAIEEA